MENAELVSSESNSGDHFAVEELLDFTETDDENDQFVETSVTSLESSHSSVSGEESPFSDEIIDLCVPIAPIYLASCVKQGMGLLEILLLQQPVQHNRTLLKTLEICRMYELDSVASKIMKIAGVHNWKHGKKGAGVFWLQQARDEVRLNRIAQQLFDFVGKSLSDEGFKEWEGLIELLGAKSRTAGGLEFLHKYRDFKKSLQQVHDGISSETARKAAESLILLMRNPSTPQRFWLPLLYDSELSMARLRPDFIEPQLPSQALSSIRLALANNLGRAILEE